MNLILLEFSSYLYILKEFHLVREAVIEEEEARRARQRVKERSQRRSSVEALTEAERVRKLLGATLMRAE